MSVEPPGAPQEASGVSEECKLFVGGISWHMSGSELEESTSLSASSLYSASPQTPVPTLLGLVAEFSPYGRCEATIMLDRHTGRSRGFGFVIFHKIADAEEAIKALHETDVDGRKVSVTKAIPQSQTAPGTPAAALLGHRRGDRYGPVGLQPHPAKVAEPGLFDHLPTIRTPLLNSMVIGMGTAVTGRMTVTIGTGVGPAPRNVVLGMTGAMAGLQTGAMTAQATQTTQHTTEAMPNTAGTAMSHHHMGTLTCSHRFSIL